MNLILTVLVVALVWWFVTRLLVGGGDCCGAARFNDFPDRYNVPCDASRIAGYNLPLSWNRMCSNLTEGFHGAPIESVGQGCQTPPDCVACERPFRGYDLSRREIFPIYWQDWKM